MSGLVATVRLWSDDKSIALTKYTSHGHVPNPIAQHFDAPNPVQSLNFGPLALAGAVARTATVRDDAPSVALDALKRSTLPMLEAMIEDGLAFALSAASNIVNKVVKSYYDVRQASETEFDMASETVDGAIKRVILISSSTPERSALGVLTATVRIRRSMVAGNVIEVGQKLSDASVTFSNDSNVLDLELPTIGNTKQTVRSSLGASDLEPEAVAAMLYQESPTLALKSVCDKLGAVAKSSYGFNDIDSIRMVYELVRLGGKEGALSANSPDCFDTEDWKKIQSHTIFSVEGTKPTFDEIDLVRTALRRGFADKPEYRARVADTVVLQVENGVDLMGSECADDGGMVLSKNDAIACLNKLGANRVIARESTGSVILLASQRTTVLKAIQTIKEADARWASLSIEQVVADRSAAMLAAPQVDQFLKLTLGFDGDRRLNSVTVEKRTRRDVGEEDSNQLAFSCWSSDTRVKTKQSMVCDGISVTP